MLRALYRCILRLHPFRFRQRFAGEMLSIFDQAPGRTAALKLLLDNLASLVRQWALRPEFWHDLSSSQHSVPDGIPSFYTLDPFRPRAMAIIQGLLLTLAVFSSTCFAIRYSWIHLLHVRIPEVQFESSPWNWPARSDVAGTSVVTPTAAVAAKRRTKSTTSAPSPPDLTAYQYPPATVVAVAPKYPAAASPSEARAIVSSNLTTTEVTRLSLESYAGTYIVGSSHGLTILITAESGHLMMEIAGQPKRLLLPRSETTFGISEVDNCQVIFRWNRDHTISGLQLFQGRTYLVARRR